MPTPPDPEQPHPGPVLEPVRVVRLRRFDALAELMREMLPERETFESFGTAPRPRPGDGTPRTSATEDDTQELPPFAATPQASPHDAGRSAPGLRRAAVAVAVGAAAVIGFGCALLLPTRQEADASPQPTHPATTAPATTTPAAPATTPAADRDGDPDGAGTLRQGDTGPEVAALQQRLLRIPDVYRDGSTDGTYDAVLTAAVARFQLWYGISGDETGVYGNDTRRALESRTSLDGGG
ncbi:peptidoglycan-binding domain-containing protein [Streptomyces diastatochromogenes]|uniref:Peptidoglycan-binding protein n=1 Tax=Streptomyces diastatochromogenes TaxID=42236 RepID=A0A233S5Y7_STRDA|nr:peptidoglycan-binding domain-containing protein [Streptomyces diastatochromogenes]OXY90952.1 peptidoglycan-binding protein [Streptomyces diastatochromogenes]